MAEAAAALMPSDRPSYLASLLGSTGELRIPPEQFYNGRRRWRGEQKLFAAVLESAIADLASGMVKRSFAAKRHASIAHQWVVYSAPTSPFSFDAITSALDITTHLLREEILRCYNAPDVEGMRRLQQLALIGVL